MISPAVPELSAERVTRYLRDSGHDVTISGVSTEPIGTGQMADSFRLELTFDGDPHGVPPTLVGKVPVGPPERRLLSANSYRTEVDFYRVIAPLLDARLAECWAAWRNDTGDEFALLLEDLAPRRPGDQITGCGGDQAMLAVRNLARVHGPVWDDDRLVEHFDPLTSEIIEGTDAVFPMMSELFLSRLGDRLSDGARAVYRRFAPLAGAFLAGQPRQTGIVHGDYRLDNLLFAPDSSDVAIVDWQTVGLGLPGRDLAFFVATSLLPDTRRELEGDLIAEYHRILVAQGVGGYDLEACTSDYAYGMFQIPLVVMFGSAIAQGTERGDEMFVVMAERGAAAIADWGTLDLL